jgi:hypothetical protein
MRCQHCQTDAGRTSKHNACCQLRFLAHAPPHVLHAAENEAARAGAEKLQAFQQAVAAEKTRLAKLKRDHEKAIATEALTLARNILAA